MALKEKIGGIDGVKKTQRLGLILYLTSLVGLIASPPIETQSFNDEFSAQTAGWANLNTFIDGNNYGFSTNDLGGTFGSGSAGGLIARGTVTSYYADLNIGGTFSRSDSISATGKLNVTAISVSPEFDGSIFVGHFNTNETSSDRFDGHVGFNLAEQDSGTLRFRAAVAFPGHGVFYGNDLLLTFPNSPRQWSYSWNPQGGVNGVGRIIATIDGPGGGTSIADIDASVVSSDFTLNAFGLSVPIAGASRDDPKSRSVYLYVDDLSYVLSTNGRPTLYINRLEPGMAELSWRTDYTGFSLESVSTLLSTNWLMVTNDVFIAPPWFNVTVLTPETSRYFRLRK